MKNYRWLLFRIPLLVFFIDLPFSVLVLLAYLHLLGPGPMELTGPGVLAVVAVYLVKTTLWLGGLLVLLAPLRRWVSLSTTTERQASFTVEAGTVLYDLPRKFSLLFGLSWAVPFLIFGGWLMVSAGHTIPFRPGHMTVTLLFSLAVFGAGLLNQYFFLTWMLAPFAEQVSLEARRRSLEIPWRTSRLRVRLVILALLLALSPALWVSALAYVSHMDEMIQRRDLRAQMITSLLAGTLESEETNQQGGEQRLLTHLNQHETERSRSFALEVDTGRMLGERALSYLEQEPGVERWIRQIAGERDAGLFRFPERNMSLAIQRVTYGDRPLLVGTVAWRTTTVSAAFVISMSVFAFAVVAWIILTALFLSQSYGSAIARISTLVRKIAREEDARQTERVPILQQDELGRLAESVNFMTDRLAASANEQASAQHRIAELAQSAARQAAQLRGVLDNMVEAVVVSNLQAKVTIANRAAQQMFEERELEGTSVLEMVERFDFRDATGQPFPPEEYPLLVAMREGETIQGALSLPGRRRERLFRITAAPIEDEQGRIVGALSVTADVTELRELDRLKDQFIKVAAHELKTPVAIVKGYAQLLHRFHKELPDSSLRLVDSIDAGADRIDRIVNDLLDISQLYVDRLHFTLKPTDWSELMQGLLAGMQKETPQHRLHWQGPDHVFVEADPARLRQVGRRLLNNAVKYSPEGGDIEVSLAVEDESAILAVRDHGIGIPAHKQSRIFESFYRAHTDTPYDYGGMGVGLYISREIVQRHGGRIRFESEEGEGSTFYVTLPVAEGPEGVKRSEE